MGVDYSPCTDVQMALLQRLAREPLALDRLVEDYYSHLLKQAFLIPHEASFT